MRAFRASYWVLIAAFGLLSIYSAQRAVLVHLKAQERELERAQRELTTLNSLWETTTLDRIRSWLVDIEEAGDIRATERHHRRTSPYFEAFYVWSVTGSRTEFLHPEEPLEEDMQALVSTRCMQAASLQQQSTMLSAQAFERCVGEDDPQMALFAASVAANLYLSAGRADRALRVLERGPVPLLFPLENAKHRGAAVYRLVARRLQAADAAIAMGDLRRAQIYLSRTGHEIVNLDGRALEVLLPFVDYPIVNDLRGIGAQEAAIRIETQLTDAQHRLLGFQEVKSRISTETLPVSHAEGEVGMPEVALAYDQYADRAYLLAFSPLGDSGKMGAVQLDQLPLLEGLLDTARPSVRQRLAVLDADGEAIMWGSALAAERQIWLQVPFGALLPHLRLALTIDEGEQASESLASLFVHLLPVALVIVLGGVALAGRVRADRELRDLVERQQAFVARVTHELKTPLAGIRVMAETLQLGAANDPVKRDRFLNRIVDETDNLTHRIDEVLNAARQPKADQRSPVKVHELVAEVLDEWAPRMEAAGVSLEQDLRPCPQILADITLLRDAVANLVDNAVKYRTEVNPRVVVVTRTSTRRIIIEVIDNGMGVPAPQRRRIFSAFARVEGAGRGKTGGHGLGLSFVRDAVRAHDGTVDCREGIDGGTRFIISLRRRRWKTSSQQS